MRTWWIVRHPISGLCPIYTHLVGQGSLWSLIQDLKGVGPYWSEKEAWNVIERWEK